MRYIGTSHGSAYIPKLLGIYEREVATCLEEAIAKAPDCVIDIGCAEGYYAVGLALRLPHASVVAFEIEEAARVAVREMASLNGVFARFEVRGKCEAEDLGDVLAVAGTKLIVCDVEGYEEKLLNPRVVPALYGARILVELHEFLVPGITDALIKRFSSTHEIKHIWQEARSRDDFPWRTLGTCILPGAYLDWAVSEWRPVRMAWLWMEPKVT